ncbi:MAG: ANTAR domain-containing protein, partial [Gaiellaceae bacterium]
EVVELREQAAQLERALESRIVIEQAKGVLAERFGIPTDTAFTLLRRAARSEQMRIHDLAALVVGASATPPPVAREVARSRPQEV